jgi:hypothetical protein
MPGSDSGLREDSGVLGYDSLEVAKHLLTILRVFFHHLQDLSSRG